MNKTSLLQYRAAYESVQQINRRLRAKVEELQEELTKERKEAGRLWLLIGQLEDTISALQDEMDVSA